MPIVTTVLLSGDVYEFEVPPQAPLYAVADLLCREILQPAQNIIFFQSERISRYSAVVEDMKVSVMVCPMSCFYVDRIDGKLFYYREDSPEEKREWDPDAVELEDSVIFSREKIETGRSYLIRKIY